MVRNYIKSNSARFWAWVNTNWFTKAVFGLAFLIIVVRLATTCIEVWEVRIGCEYYDYEDAFMDSLNPVDD